jgi:cullin-4
MSFSKPGGHSGPAAAGGAKKMIIKPFKTQPKLPENYEHETWIKLQSAVRAVNNKIATEISKEELYRVSTLLTRNTPRTLSCSENYHTMVNIYRQTLLMRHFKQAVEDLCMHKLGAKIYENLHKECEDHIFSKVDGLVGQVGSTHTFHHVHLMSW